MSILLVVTPALWLGPNKWFPYAGDVQTVRSENANNGLALLYWETGILKVSPYLWDMDEQMLARQTAWAVDIDNVNLVHRICLRSSNTLAGEPVQEQFTGWPLPWLRSSWPVDRPANVSPWGLKIDGVSPIHLAATILTWCTFSIAAVFGVAMFVALVTRLPIRTHKHADPTASSITD